MRSLFSCILLALTAGVTLVSAESVIVPGARWTDTSGNTIQAHGAGILKVSILKSSMMRLEPDKICRLARHFTGLVKTKQQTVPYFQPYLVIP